MSPSQEPAPKRRNRLSLSCNYCKKRKVKCDRGRPCTSCVKYHVAELCEYPVFLENYKSLDESPSVPETPGLGKTPTFAVQNVNEFKDRLQDGTRYIPPLDQTKKPIVFSTSPNKSPVYTSDKSGSPDSSISGVQVMSELEFLKNRINFLEGRFGDGDLKTPAGSNGVTPTGLNGVTAGPTGVTTGNNGENAVKSRENGEEGQGIIPGANNQPKYQLPLNTYKHRNSFDNIASGISRHGSFSFNTASPLMRLPFMSGGFNNNPEVHLSPLNWTPAQTEAGDYVNSCITSDNTLTTDSKRGKVNNQIKAKMVAVNPHENSDDIIDFYAGYNPRFHKTESRRIIFGVFAWWTFLRKVAALTRVYEYLQNSLQQDLYSTNCVVSKGADLQETTREELIDTQVAENEKQFRNRATKYEAFTDNKPYSELRETAKNTSTNADDSPGVRSKLNEGALSLGLTVFEGDIYKELELADQIVYILPCKKVIWLLINKFFTHVYAYMPFFDESSFKSEIARIIGPEDYVDQKVEKVNVEKRLDFAYLGIMLLMLRFAYLSMFSNKKQVNELNLKSNSSDPKQQEMKFLLSNPISIQVIDMAQHCANQFDILKKSNLVVLQLMYGLRLYTMFGPEKGDGSDGGASQISNGMLIQVAFSMGINREPESFEGGRDNDGKENNLIRKLWFFMVITDLIQGYQYGNPLAIDPKYFDVRLPFFKKGNENIEDVKMEKDVISTFAYFDKYYSKLKSVLDYSTQSSVPCKSRLLTEKLSDFEDFISSVFGNIQDYMVPFSKELYNYPFIKTMKFKNFINLNGFIVSLLAHLHLHYERNDNVKLSVYYLKKKIVIGTLNFMPYYNEMIGKNHINFGESADLILNPSTIAFMHKTHQFALAVFVKANATVHYLRGLPTHDKDMKSNYDYQIKFYKYCKLSKILEKLLKYSIASISRLSNRYYYAWRITKAHSFILHVVTKTRVYEICDFSDVTTKFLQIPLEDIDDLTFLYDLTLKQISEDKSSAVETDIDGIVKFTKKDASPMLPQTSPGTDFGNTPAATSSSNNTKRQPAAADKDAYSSLPEGFTPPEAQKWPNVTHDSDYTPHSNSSDNDYFDMVNNKEVDDLWLQLIGENNEPGTTYNDGNGAAVQTSDFYSEMFQVPETFNSY